MNKNVGGVLFICIILLLQLGAQGLKHHLSVVNEKRQRFFVESFGFEAGGVVEVDFQNIKVSLHHFDTNTNIYFLEGGRQS
jgi:hypothetical protein